MYKEIVQAKLREQFADDKIVVKTVVEQDLIWENKSEVRAFCEDGVVYSAMYDGNTRTTNYCIVPKEAVK